MTTCRRRSAPRRGTGPGSRRDLVAQLRRTEGVRVDQDVRHGGHDPISCGNGAILSCAVRAFRQGRGLFEGDHLKWSFVCHALQPGARRALDPRPRLRLARRSLSRAPRARVSDDAGRSMRRRHRRRRARRSSGQPVSGSDARPALSTDCTFRYTWQRCNAERIRLRRRPGRDGLHLPARPAPTSRGVCGSSNGFKRDSRSAPSPARECHDVTKNAMSAPTAVVRRSRFDGAERARRRRSRGWRWRKKSCGATGGTWTGPGTIDEGVLLAALQLDRRGVRDDLGATGAAYKLTSEDVGQRSA